MREVIAGGTPGADRTSPHPADHDPDITSRTLSWLACPEVQARHSSAAAITRSLDRLVQAAGPPASGPARHGTQTRHCPVTQAAPRRHSRAPSAPVLAAPASGPAPGRQVLVDGGTDTLAGQVA